VEIALKMAYQYWTHIEGKPRKSFITFQDAYHGDTVGSVSLGGMPLFHDIFKGLLFNTLKMPATSTYNNGNIISLEEAGRISLAETEKALKQNPGEIVQPEGFVNQLSNLAERYNTLLICDEVATGFGRTGEMFACQSEKICPDIMTVAKGLTAGYLPVAATLTKEKIFSAFLGEYHENKTFFHGHTYTGNQLGCAAAIANIDLMVKHGSLSNVKKISAHFAEKLSVLGNASPFIGEIRRKGLMTGIEIVSEKTKRIPFPAEKRVGHAIIMECRKHGVLTRNLGDVIVINPPLSITEKEIDAIISALSHSIKSIAGNASILLN
jgi:adenosylmethionine-8-amino-7-oxononanoate aminotransferase